ncbi:MAG: hypothetical protein ABIK09_09385 [Pseudomonadota bacterium]
MSEGSGVQAAGPAVALGAILLVLAGAALLTGQGPPELDGRLDSWRPGAQVRLRLQEIRLRRADVEVPVEAARELIDAWRAASAAPFSTGPSPQRRVRSAELRFQQVATRFLADHGAPAHAAVGEALAGPFMEALDGLAEVAGDGHKATWLASHRDHGVAREVRALGGQFPERALASGLLSPVGPLDPDRREVARILWTTHWFETARAGLAAEVMSPEERLLVRLWKVEDATHLSWQRRRAIMEEVRAAAPDYPADYVLGVLASRYGLVDEARASFQRALDAGYRPELVRFWLGWLARTGGP